MLKFRFVEKEYIAKNIQNNSEYITAEDIESILSPSYIYDDITISIIPTSKTGFATKIYDNNAEEEITLDELNGFALDYYYKVVKEYSIKQQKESRIADEQQKIRDILTKWSNERKDNKKLSIAR